MVYACRAATGERLSMLVLCGLLATICLKTGVAATNCFNAFLRWNVRSTETKEFSRLSRQHYPLIRQGYPLSDRTWFQKERYALIAHRLPFCYQRLTEKSRKGTYL